MIDTKAAVNKVLEELHQLDKALPRNRGDRVQTQMENLYYAIIRLEGVVEQLHHDLAKCQDTIATMSTS